MGRKGEAKIEDIVSTLVCLCLPVNLSVHLFVCLSLSIRSSVSSSIYLFISLSVCSAGELSVSPLRLSGYRELPTAWFSKYRFVYLPVCHSICLSVWCVPSGLSLCLFLCLSSCLPTCLFAICPSTYLSVHMCLYIQYPYICICIYVSVCLHEF